jgi:hypothetical protein
MPPDGSSYPFQDPIVDAVNGTADGLLPPYRIDGGAPYRTAKLFRRLAFSSEGIPTLHHHHDGFLCLERVCLPRSRE